MYYLSGFLIVLIYTLRMGETDVKFVQSRPSERRRVNGSPLLLESSVYGPCVFESRRSDQFYVKRVVGQQRDATADIWPGIRGVSPAGEQLETLASQILWN